MKWVKRATRWMHLHVQESSEGFFKRKMMKVAVDLFIRMMDNGEGKPSAHNCGAVLQELSFFSSPDVDLVFKAVETLRDDGGHIDKAMYVGIHRSLSRSGRFDEAEDVVML